MVKREVLVTGGSGYIGSVLCKKLLKKGWDVLNVDLLPPQIDVKTYQRDIRDLTQLTDIFKIFKPNYVVHLASQIQIGESMINPLKYFDHNSKGTINVCLNYLGVKKLVFASSAGIYSPDNKIMPLTEDSIIAPKSYYGITKAHDEDVVNSLKVYSTKTTIFRFFNVAGSLFNIKDKCKSHLLPAIIRGMKGEEQFKLFGYDYKTRDGTCIRDYIHVGDIADAIILALESKKSGTYNLGTNKGYTVKEMIQMVEKISGKDFDVVYSARRDGDAPELVASSKKAEQELGWKRRYGLKDIITSQLKVEGLI